MAMNNDSPWSPSTVTEPSGACPKSPALPSAPRGMMEYTIAARSGRDITIWSAKHTPITATSEMMNASIRRMPRLESARSSRTSSAVMSTPTSSGIPNRSCRPMAAPSTSARSHATIAISHRIHSGHTRKRG